MEVYKGKELEIEINNKESKEKNIMEGENVIEEIKIKYKLLELKEELKELRKKEKEIRNRIRKIKRKDIEEDIVRCNNCEKLGHIRRDCYQLRKYGKYEEMGHTKKICRENIERKSKLLTEEQKKKIRDRKRYRKYGQKGYFMKNCNTELITRRENDWRKVFERIEIENES